MNYQFQLDLNKKSPKLDIDDICRYQIRLACKDSNPQIKNKKLILSRGYFHTPCLLTYEKHFTREEKDVVEYYENDVLDSYFETIKVNKIQTIEGFGPDGTLFTREIKHFKNGNHFKSEIMIHKAVGTTLHQTDYY